MRSWEDIIRKKENLGNIKKAIVELKRRLSGEVKRQKKQDMIKE